MTDSPSATDPSAADPYRILGPTEGLGSHVSPPETPQLAQHHVADVHDSSVASIRAREADAYSITRHADDPETADDQASDHHVPVVETIRPRRDLRLVEAVGLSLGMYFFHFAAVVAGILLLAVIHGGGTLIALRRVVEQLQAHDSSVHAVLLLFTQSSTLVYASLLAALIFRPGGFRQLGWKSPRLLHLSLIVVMTLPIALIGAKVQEYVLNVLPGSDSGLHEQLKIAGQMPYPLLIYVIAVLPALGEEILFRGVIGRRLGDAFSPVATILLTTILFGAIHGNPAQAIAVMPLGLMMHFLYLTTRTLWTPILLHFLNNALAATVLKFGDGISMGQFMESESPIPLDLIVVCGSLVITVCAAVWHTREVPTTDDSPTLDRNLADVLNRIELRAEEDESRRISSLIATAMVVHCFAFVVCMWMNRP